VVELWHIEMLEMIKITGGVHDQGVQIPDTRREAIDMV
jgi:hypothetical protein